MKDFFSVVVCLALVLCARADPYEVVIRGGRIVDGSGNPGYFADVAVKDGKIAKIGRITDPATTVIDATHLVVAPGFIDAHTHADEVAEHPRAENFVRMGVTSIVVGNCGGSKLDIGQLFKDLQKFMQHPNTMIACDSGIRVFGEGVPHPRGYGNNARVLGRYVRDLHVLRLEDAIRKMTSLPANTFQFANRGELRVGNWADIVVFDPAKVLDMATYNDPHHYPVGIPDVLVNGVLVVKDGEHTDARPGQALRHVVN